MNHPTTLYGYGENFLYPIFSTSLKTEWARFARSLCFVRIKFIVALLHGHSNMRLATQLNRITNSYLHSLLRNVEQCDYLMNLFCFKNITFFSKLILMWRTFKNTTSCCCCCCFYFVRTYSCSMLVQLSSLHEISTKNKQKSLNIVQPG